MKYVGMAVHLRQPFICSHMKTQYERQRKNRQEALYNFRKTIVRGIKDQVSWTIFTCQVCSKTTAQASSVDNHVILLVTFSQFVVHKLHVAQHVLLTSFASTFSKATIVDQNNVVVIAKEIGRIFCPTFDTAAITMKIKDKAERLPDIKMKPIDPNPFLNIKKQFLKRCIVPILEILLQLFRLENEALLQQVNRQQQYEVPDNDINDGLRQRSFNV